MMLSDACEQLAVHLGCVPQVQARIVRLLIDRVIVNTEGVQINFRADGLHALLDEWRGTIEGE